MVRRTAFIIAAIALLRSEKCDVSRSVVSLNDIAATDQLVTDSSFEGLWISPEPHTDTVRVLGHGGHYVATSWSEGTVPQSSDLFFTRIGGQLYADVSPREIEQRNMDVALPVHLFVRVDRVRPVLTYRTMDMNWLKQFAASHASEISAVDLRGPIILTDSTAVLRAFLRRHAADSGAFGKDSGMWIYAGPSALRQ